MLAPFAAVLLAAVPPPPCAAVPPPAVQFSPGEQLKFRLDLLGADVGTFDLSLEHASASEKDAALAVRSRARTSAFVATNLGRYDAFATSLLGKDLRPVSYREEVDEGPTHKTIEVRFPPAGGKLPISATKDGNPDSVELEAGPTARDMLSTLYLLRGQVPGRSVCVDVYAGRKVWRLEGSMAAGEEIETPLGKFKTLRFDGTATRLDDGNVKRSAHVWVSDDARRLPLVAIGEVKSKTIRAQLVEATGAAARAAPGRKDPASRNPPRVGAAIGR
jgi:uncharacterized protein DUF3108